MLMNVEKYPDSDLLKLCIEENGVTRVLAIFTSAADAEKYIELRNLEFKSAHAMGQSGI